MFWKGLAIIPLNVRKESNGKVRDLVQAPYYGRLLKYSDSKRLATVYLSISRGIVYYDDYLDREVLTGDCSSLWYSVVAEQVFRLCIDWGVSIVHFMEPTLRYENLVHIIQGRGVRVVCPIQGLSLSAIQRALDFGVILG